MTEQALAWALELGFTSINFDLIYGLPHQTVESFNRTLDIVLTCNPIAWPFSVTRTCHG
jgi:oxygen-independent coproporphyrinogen-3 oxidase